MLKNLGGQRVAILIQCTSKSWIIEEFGTAQVIPKSLPLRLMAMRVVRAYWFLHGRAFGDHCPSRGVRRRMFKVFFKERFWIQRTSRSLIIEELRGSKGSHFDTAHEQELDY